MQTNTRSHFIFCWILISLLLPFNALPRTSELQGKDLHLSLQFGGTQRTYTVHVPPGNEAHRAFPVLFAFHPLGGTAASFERTTGFDSTSDKYGFLVVYPDSIGPKWKLIGRNNDIAFNESLLRTLKTNYRIDASRVYVTGFSQGGGMAQALACRDTDKIAGAAVVSENLSPGMERRCHPSRPILILVFHGTMDPISPYKGGRNGGYSGRRTYSARQTAEFWARNNHCVGSPVMKRTPDRLSNGTAVTDTEVSWEKCRNHKKVRFYTVTGAGHTWPGSQMKVLKLGAVSKDLNASRIILKTFSVNR